MARGRGILPKIDIDKIIARIEASQAKATRDAHAGVAMAMFLLAGEEDDDKIAQESYALADAMKRASDAGSSA